MYQFLNDPFDEIELRYAARRVVGEMAIIQGAQSGDRQAYGAMLSGWWPYVTGFERAMRYQLVKMLPIEPLAKRYGEDRAREFRRAALKEVIEMQQEEGSHAAMWEADAKREGFPLPLDSTCYTVKRLLSEIVLGTDPVRFWSQLAATEFIAECVTERLHSSPEFMTRFFPSGKWEWGEAHLIHPREISHREMDLDITVGYAADNPVVRDMVLNYLRLFAIGSQEVARMYLKQMRTE